MKKMKNRRNEPRTTPGRAARFSLVAALVLALTSCLSIDAKIDLSANGSGTLNLRYELSRYAANVGRMDGSDTLLMFPLEREDFEGAAARIGGLEILEYEKRETEESVLVIVRIGFDSLTDVSRLFSTQDIREPIVFEQEGLRRQIRFFLYQGISDPPSADILALYTALFKGDTVRIACTLPAPVKTVSTGQILADAKTAVLFVPVLDMTTRTEPLVWEITF
jgi:hypothetical protein